MINIKNKNSAQETPLRHQAKIIGVTGGKGGTGKTTVSTALAYKLSKNHKVLLVDADVDCPNGHLLLNIKRKLYKKVEQRIPVWDLKKCTKCGLCGTVCKTSAIASIKGKYPIFIPSQCNGCGACVLKCPVKAIGWSKKEIGRIYNGMKYNIDLLSGELKINEPVSEFVVNSLNEIIDKKKNKYDYIIIDTAAGIHCPVIAALEVCDTVLAVTEPTPLGAHDLELILQLLIKLRIKTDIILNRSDMGDKNIIKSLVKQIRKKAAQGQPIKIIASIPYSKKIIEQSSCGKPIIDPNIATIINKVK